ncbi:MAG: hypothetical protein KDA61_05820 [Planctomycetales bacterium]|nr:hypothetical protein [Planctomycetales bacterium]
MPADAPSTTDNSQEGDNLRQHDAGSCLRSGHRLVRYAVALASVGWWWQLAFLGESPLFEWWQAPVSLGGWGMPESTAYTLSHAVGWTTLVAGLVVAVRPSFWVAMVAAAVPCLTALAVWRMGEGFPVEAAWLPLSSRKLFPFLTHAARAVAPLAAVALAGRPNGSLRFSAGRVAMLLRVALATTFAAHGIEAWQQNPEFIDLLIGSASLVSDEPLNQSAAEQTLAVVAMVDWLAAAACLLMPSTRAGGVPKALPTTLLWMALWGGVTAASRVTAWGWYWGWFQMLIRAPHALLPIATIYFNRSTALAQRQVPPDANLESI